PDRRERELGTAETKSHHSEQVAREPTESGGDDHAVERRHTPVERHKSRRVGAHAEERRVAERQLPAGEQQVHARYGQEEDAGHDQQRDVVIVEHEREDRECGQHEHAGPQSLHRRRSRRPNRPAGRKSRSRMMTMKPIASLYPDEMYAAPRLSATPSSRPPTIAPRKSPSP